MKKKAFIVIIPVIIIILTGFLVLHKNIRVTPAFVRKYELCGIDVSHYQGNIDFAQIKEQGIDFVFIKATEGSSHKDECFDENWENVQETELFAGAYHFFSFDSSGKMQANHFISTVGNLNRKLPPVIDVEYYGGRENDPPDPEIVAEQLKDMLAALEEHYQAKPIIYTTYRAYNDFIKGRFEDYPLWIRNVYYPPVFKDWTFWQYTDRAVLKGYKGTEKYIDMNVFKGTREDLKKMVVAGREEEIADKEQGTVYEIAEEIPLLEELFTYDNETRYSSEINNYLVITGINEQYKDRFEEYMKMIASDTKYGSAWALIPGDINGIPVKVIGEEAFKDISIDQIVFSDNIEIICDRAFKNSGIKEVQFSHNLKVVGEEAFENCNLISVKFPDQPIVIGSRAFAENEKLWKVLFQNAGSVIEEDSFIECDPDLLVCCGEKEEEKKNRVRQFADDHDLEYLEILMSKEPIVNYPAELATLHPEVKGFFYGEDGDYDAEGYWDFEMSEEAPNFGFIDWHLPGCSTWCGCYGFTQEAEATSKLASHSGRYDAENILRQNRYLAWAEGADGPGIGESITYWQSCEYSVPDRFGGISKEDKYSEPFWDGFMRYSEICIVNGYARDSKTWEENGRVKTLLMKVEGKPYAYIELEDTILPQYFILPENDIMVYSGEMIEFEFVIEEVYPGSLYEDTCLTGIVMEFTGRYAH